MYLRFLKIHIQIVTGLWVDILTDSGRRRGSATLNGGGTTEENKPRTLGLCGSDGGKGVTTSGTRRIFIGVPKSLQSSINRSRELPRFRAHPYPTPPLTCNANNITPSILRSCTINTLTEQSIIQTSELHDGPRFHARDPHSRPFLRN